MEVKVSTARLRAFIQKARDRINKQTEKIERSDLEHKYDMLAIYQGQDMILDELEGEINWYENVPLDDERFKGHIWKPQYDVEISK